VINSPGDHWTTDWFTTPSGRPPASASRELLVIVWIGVGSGLAVGLLYRMISSVTWPTTIAWLQLQRSRRVPAVGLVPFLDDARTRGVLRTVGAVYQFRHATLQEHLVGQTTSSPATSSAAGRPSS
jgi:hypothetical protein